MSSIKFFLLAAWFCVSFAASAQIFYVGPNGNDDINEGINEDTPFRTIEYAISQVVELSSEIRVLSSEIPYIENTLLINKPGLTISGLEENVIINPADGSNPLINIAANGVTLEGLTLSGGNAINGIVIENVAPEGVEDIVIRQNTISGFTSGIAIAPGAEVNRLTISNNFIRTNTNAVLINPSFVADIVISENDMSGNEVALVNNSGVLVNASLNWWGGFDPSQVTNTLAASNGSINNLIDYNPWLNRAIDSDADNGFQPNLSELSIRKQNNEAVLAEAIQSLDVEGTLTLYNSIASAYEALTIDKVITLASASGQNPMIDALTLNQALEISGTLTVNSLTLNNNTITVSTLESSKLLLPLAVVDGLSENALIIGPVEILPQTVGVDQSIQALGVTIASGPEALGQVTIQRNAGITAVVNGDFQSIRTIWDIKAQNNSFTPRQLTLEWPSAYDNNVETDLAVVWKNAGDEIVEGEWTQVSIDTVINSQISDTERRLTIEVSSFSQFTVSDINQPLPVELTHFSASLAEPHVALTWETTSERNSDFFSIERSENGKDFEEIGQLKAAGSSTNSLQYQYIDEQAASRFSGSLFYRLRTVDFDGSFEYSDITTVIISEEDIPMITAFARQGMQSLKLFTRAIEPGDYHVWITDLSGRKIFEQDIQLAPKEAYELGTGNLPQSVYLIRCVGRQLALSTKFRIEEAE